jgi:hypothetical protein
MTASGAAPSVVGDLTLRVTRPTAPATTTTSAAPTTTVAPPTTTSTPATSTTERRPAPATTAPPVPRAPAAAPPAVQPSTSSPLARAESAMRASVPGSWFAAIPVHVRIVSGWTSWSYHDHTIEIGDGHASGSWSRLRVVTAHEFGHQIAFEYGTQTSNGAAPAGWPSLGTNPVETWADCVSQVFTGIVDPSPGLPACSGASLSWTSGWLAGGPAAHPRTG